MFKNGLQEKYSGCQTKRDKCNLSIIEYSLTPLYLKAAVCPSIHGLRRRIL